MIGWIPAREGLAHIAKVSRCNIRDVELKVLALLASGEIRSGAWYFSGKDQHNHRLTARRDVVLSPRFWCGAQFIRHGESLIAISLDNLELLLPANGPVSLLARGIDYEARGIFFSSDDVFSIWPGENASPTITPSEGEGVISSGRPADADLSPPASPKPPARQNVSEGALGRFLEGTSDGILTLPELKERALLAFPDRIIPDEMWRRMSKGLGRARGETDRAIQARQNRHS
jgi:hypothetical protein